MPFYKNTEIPQPLWDFFEKEEGLSTRQLIQAIDENFRKSEFSDLNWSFRLLDRSDAYDLVRFYRDHAELSVVDLLQYNGYAIRDLSVHDKDFKLLKWLLDHNLKIPRELTHNNWQFITLLCCVEGMRYLNKKILSVPMLKRQTYLEELLKLGYQELSIRIGDLESMRVKFKFMITDAIRDNDIKTVRKVLREEPDLVNGVSGVNSPLTDAVLVAYRYPDYKMIDFLLSAKADINQPGICHQTPLEIACNHLNINLCNYLLLKGADAIQHSGFYENLLDVILHSYYITITNYKLIPQLIACLLPALIKSGISISSLEKAKSRAQSLQIRRGYDFENMRAINIFVNVWPIYFENIKNISEAILNDADENKQLLPYQYSYASFKHQLLENAIRKIMSIACYLHSNGVAFTWLKEFISSIASKQQLIPYAYSYESYQKTQTLLFAKPKAVNTDDFELIERSEFDHIEENHKSGCMIM